MADIRLAKPAAGASQSVPCEPEARFVFDFPTTDATLARDGDNLNIRFEDGSSLQLEGFYQQYNEENLPSFNIDGTEVAAADFFQAMNEPDLMPAAGPGTGTVANGARFHEWGDSALTGGIQHLDGLDWGFSRSFEWDDVPNAVGRNGDDWGWGGTPDNPVTLVPEDPTPVPPGTPGVPGIPTGGEPGNQGIVPPGDVRVVDEAGLRNGGTVSVNGAMRITAPDGLASIEIGGQAIWQNGHLIGNPSFATDEGYFHNFAYDAASGRLTYTYTLTSSTQEHGQAGPDHIAHSLPVTVRDTDGDSASSNITIVIRDDVAEAANDFDKAVEGHEISGNVLDNDNHGADGAGAFAGGKTVRWDFPEGTREVTEDGRTWHEFDLKDADGKQYGTVELFDDGTYVLKAETLGNSWGEGERTFSAPSIGYTIVDADGDTAHAVLDLEVLKSEPGITPGGGPEDPNEPSVVAGRVQVDEGAQPEQPHDGRHDRTGEGSFNVNLNDETDGCSIELKDSDGNTLTITFDAQGNPILPEGTLSALGVNISVKSVTLNPDGTWHVTYAYDFTADSLAHTGEDGANLSTLGGEIAITVKDSSGDHANAVLKVEVHDDAPQVTLDGTPANEFADTDSTIHTDSTLEGHFEVSFGADGMADAPFTYKGEALTRGEGNTWSLTTEDGTLTLTRGEGNTWTYSFAPNEGAVIDETLELVAIDGDGDTAAVKIPLKLDRDPGVKPGPGETEVFADRITVDEGDQPQCEGAHGHDGHGFFIVNLYGENGTVVVGDAEGNQVELRLENGALFTAEGTVVVNGVTLSGFTATKGDGTEWKISYDYKFTADQLDHGKPGADTDITLQDTVGIHVTDDSGGEASAQIVVNVHDDIPTLTVTPGEEQSLKGEAEDGTTYTYYQNFEGSLDAAFGADGAAKVEALTINGQPVVLDENGSFVYTDDDGQLTIRLTEDGTYTYSYKPADDGTDLFVRQFDVVATDGDGDQTPGVITVSQNYKPGLGSGDANFDPDGKTLTIKMDEATLNGGTGGQGDTEHPYEGDSHFVAKFNGGEDGTITIGTGDDTYVITVRHTEAGYEIANTDGKTTIELNGVKVTFGNIEPAADGSITVNFHYELTGAQTHTKAGEWGKEDVFAAATIPVEIEDSVNGDTAKGDIKFEVHDDGPKIGGMTPTTLLDSDDPVPGEKLNFVFDADQLKFVDNNGVTTTAQDFKDNGIDLTYVILKTPASGKDWTIQGYNASKTGADYDAYILNYHGVEIIPTYVKYTYGANGELQVDLQNDVDYHWVPNPDSNSSYRKEVMANKKLGLTDEGLTVGKSGTGAANGDEYGADELSVINGNMSEAITFENSNHQISYGVQIEFGKLDDGENVVIGFYLTPTNSNDNSTVKLVQAVYPEPGETYTWEGTKLCVNVPDGFTKVIVSAAPNEVGDTDSGFTIKNFQFMSHTQRYEGSLDFNAGADGLHTTDDVPDGVAWKWDGIENGGTGKVNIIGVVNSGEYDVEYTVTGGSIKAVITSGKLNGETLFEGTLDTATGTWNISQNYKFTLQDGSDAIFNVTFTVTDAEGDAVNGTYPIDLSNPVNLQRFDVMTDGSYNSKVENGTIGGWGTNSIHDNAYDVLVGTGVNDLIYGRGGNDILFGDGDKQAFDAMSKYLLGEVKDYKGPDNNLPAGGKPSLNNALYDELAGKIDELGKKDDGTVDLGALKAALGKLQDEVENASSGQKGDDGLFGGVGNDILFGGAGDDYLSGNGKIPDSKNGQTGFTDSDILLGGSGNDIIVFDANDKIIDGGNDNDILLAGSDCTVSLKEMLANNGSINAKVFNIEVLLKSTKTRIVENLGITSHASLLTYGIILGENGLKLDGSRWTLFTEDREGYKTYRSNDGALEIQTKLDVDDASWETADKAPAPDGSEDLATAGLVPADDGGEDAVPDGEAQLFAMRQGAGTEEDGDNAGPAASAPSAGRAAPSVKNVIEGDGDEPNTLFGTDGDDVIIGGSANDFIDGGAGSDTIYAGDGNDLIVYDANDYLIDGGEGIDFLLAGDAQASLGELLGNGDAANGPMVHNVEVLLKGVDTTSLTSMDKLAEKFGLRLEKGEDGQDRLMVDTDQWTRGDTADGVTTWTNNADANITLETTLQQTSESEGQAVLSARVAAETGGNG